MSLLGGVLVLVATRMGPLLSPDSITYLSAAQHLRHGAGLTDFTGRPLSVFGPVYPILLSPGGRSLLWARVVGAVAVTMATALMLVLLRRRVPLWAALPGAAAFAACQGLVSIASTAWSEAPYLAIALATLVVLTAEPLTPRRVAAGGVLAGCAFLTRYAGGGLIVTGAVIVAVTSLRSGRRLAARDLAIYCASAASIPAIWVTRNLQSTGQALGPRFHGGASEPIEAMMRRSTVAIGQLLVGPQVSYGVTVAVGVAALVAFAFATVIVLRRRTRPDDLGVIAFGWTCLLVPIVARALTASDINVRVLSPTLLPIVYFATVAIASVRRWRPAVLVGAVLAGWWMYQGVDAAAHFPDVVTSTSEARVPSSPALDGLIADLPPAATVMTNDPYEVWWLTRREPTLLAFTKPRPGKSYVPISADDTLAHVCRGNTYLAWFGLGGVPQGPVERRPDIAAVVRLDLEREVPGGALYRLSARDAELCPPA